MFGSTMRPPRPVGRQLSGAPPAHLRRSDPLVWVLPRRAWPQWANPLSDREAGECSCVHLPHADREDLIAVISLVGHHLFDAAVANRRRVGLHSCNVAQIVPVSLRPVACSVTATLRRSPDPPHARPLDSSISIRRHLLALAEKERRIKRIAGPRARSRQWRWSVRRSSLFAITFTKSAEHGLVRLYWC
jgi:hypothetical protein